MLSAGINIGVWAMHCVDYFVRDVEMKGSRSGKGSLELVREKEREREREKGRIYDGNPPTLDLL